MSNSKLPRIGISIGDTNGIGLELILKTFRDERILKRMVPLVYGSTRVINFHRKALQLEDFHYSKVDNASQAQDGKLNVINCWNEEVNVKLGTPTKESGRYAYRSLEAAVRDLKNDRIEALVTCPISKENIQSKDFDFPGHTEYLQASFDSVESLMFLVGEKMRVGLVTNHLPVSEVAASITQELISTKLKLINKSLQSDFSINGPRIAVLGLNPHAGDQGLLGKEEEEIISPAIELAKNDGIYAYGPFPADGFFASSAFMKYDAILAMYHDQGLIPFKMAEFGSGVNFTAGLNVVRTSPDHGTGFDIAGKGKASTDSFRKALFAAVDILRNRKSNMKLIDESLTVN